MARPEPHATNVRMRELELSDGVITLSPLRPEDAGAHLAGEDEEAGNRRR